MKTLKNIIMFILASVPILIITVTIYQEIFYRILPTAATVYWVTTLSLLLIIMLQLTKETAVKDISILNNIFNKLDLKDIEFRTKAEEYKNQEFNMTTSIDYIRYMSKSSAIKDAKIIVLEELNNQLKLS